MSRENGTRASGHVYFVQRDGEGGAIKIGWTAHLTERVYSLGNQDTVKLLGTVPGTPFTEAQIHRLLDADRLTGEWFKPTAKVLDAAQGVGLDHITGNVDPFDAVGDVQVAQPTRQADANRHFLGEKDHRREQIAAFYENGATGFATASYLRLSLPKFTREVRLMDQLGYFDKRRRLARRRAAQAA